MRISDLQDETDAGWWVDAWLRTVAARPGKASDRDVLEAWFGSAIEAGRRAGRRDLLDAVLVQYQELREGARRAERREEEERERIRAALLGPPIRPREPFTIRLKDEEVG